MSSFLAAILGFALVAQSQAHVSLVSIYGSNKAVGHAFGVDLNGRYPRVLGAPGDAGGDSGIFETGTDTPSPACGRTPELGPLDLSAWLDQAEGFGLPAAYSNMSVVIEVFQVNRDGGGPMMCEYNEDATATSWKPMFMSLNQAGNSGIQNQQRVNSTVVANFPQDATCNGGFTQTACIVRCRTGFNRRFGGCFAVKLSDSVPFAVRVTNSTGADLNSTVISRVSDSSDALSDEDINRIADKIVSSMQSSGFLISAAAIVSLGKSSSPVTNSSSGVISRLLETTQSTSNTSLPASASVVSGNSTTGSRDASDAADASDVADASDATDASDVADASDATDASSASDAADAITPDASVNTTSADASDAADAASSTDSNESSDTTDAHDAADAATFDADLSTSTDTDTSAFDATTSEQPAMSRSKRHLRNVLSKRFKANLSN